MSTLAVAKKDFKDTRRTKTLWIVVGLLTFLGGLMAFVSSDGARYGRGAEALFKDGFLGVGVIMTFIFPLVVLVATYLAIAGERESGSIKFMLSLPNSRLHVFTGKVLSRSAIVAGAIGLTFLVVSGILAANLGTLPIGFVIGVTAMMLLYAQAFVSVAIALSASMASRTRAIAGAVAAYFVLVVFYLIPTASVSDVVHWLHHDLLGMAKNPDLYDFVTYTSPFMAFRKSLNLVLPVELRNGFTQPFRLGRGRASAAGSDPTGAIELPVYLTDEFSLVILGFWIVVPLVIGYWRFERADL